MVEKLSDVVARISVDKVIEPSEVRELQEVTSRPQTREDQDAVDNLYMQVASGVVQAKDAKSELEMITALSMVRAAPQTNDLSKMSAGEVTAEVAKGMSVKDKVELTERFLNAATWDGQEKAIIRIVESMTSPQLSLYLMQLRVNENVEELHDDVHGTEYATLKQRLVDRLPEVTPQAGALILSKFLPNGADADSAIRRLSQTSPDKAGKILAAYTELGLSRTDWRDKATPGSSVWMHGQASSPLDSK